MNKIKYSTWGKVLVGILVCVMCLVVFFTHQSNRNEKTNVYLLLPLTGSGAQVSSDLKKTLEIYLSRNTNCLFNVKLVDSEFNPMKAIAAIKQATVGDDNFIVVSCITSVTAAIVPVVEELGGFTIPFAALKSQALVGRKSFQRISYNADDVAKLPADYLIKMEKVAAVLYSNEDYGIAAKDIFCKEFEAKGGQILAKIPFSTQEQNTREVIKKVIDIKSPSLYVVGVGVPAYANIFRTLKAQGYDGKIVADIVFGAPFVYTSLGADAEGITFVTSEESFSSPSTELARVFREDCLAKGMTPYYFLAEFFDTLCVIDHILSNKCKIEQDTFSKEIKEIETASGTLRFLPNGDCCYRLKLATISNNTIVPVPEK